MTDDKFKEHCKQIYRQLDSLMERRTNNKLILIKSQIDNIIDNPNKDEVKKLCTSIIKQLDVPLRRLDDWRIEIIKEKVKIICPKK